MPLTFLLVALIIIAGLASPLVIGAVFFAASRSRTRATGEYLRRWGLRAAGAAVALTFAVSALFREPPTIAGTVLGAGAAFTFGCAAALIVRRHREAKSMRTAG